MIVEGGSLEVESNVKIDQGTWCGKAGEKSLLYSGIPSMAVTR
jgi:hypothetical protein